MRVERLLATALLLVAALPLVKLYSGQVVRKDPRGPGRLEELGLTVPMRDGVHLAADLFLPAATGRFPTVLVRTPYNRKAPGIRSFYYFLNRGYALVVEDVRGRHASQGTFGAISQEAPDGSDTVDWVARQPWSNGRVVMAGSSYLGMVQWWAALEDNPHLAAISPMTSGDDDYTDRFYSPGGALQVGHRLLWLAENFTPPSKVPAALDTYIRHLPLATADLPAAGIPLPVWRSALAHPSFDNYWKRVSLRERIKKINLPILSLGGWFDNYAESDLDAFHRLALAHKPVDTWIGPWGHNPGTRFPTRNFGPQAILGIRAKQADWFDRWIGKKDASNGRPAPPLEPLLHIFVMGPDIWREEHEWPLARTRYTPLYLASEGAANSASGDGVLRWQPVRTSHTDTFTYDPKTPVPTVGGSVCCEPAIFPPGPLNQASVESRPDVLVYTSPPLNEDIEVTGPIRTVLYASTSVNDTDFTAKLVDVYPDGRPLLVTDGIQRLRYRLSLEEPVFVKRNQAYQISIDTGVTSCVFAAGHRFRVEISSSNFPRFDRNLNTTGPNSDQSKLIKAKQTVYHEKGYPSAIILPIVGRSRDTFRGSGFRAIQSRATKIAPPAIKMPPSAFPQVSRSPSRNTANTITNTTLSLSIGASREAGPDARARK
jgi:putative CocE/NonD family hydrolase